MAFLMKYIKEKTNILNEPGRKSISKTPSKFYKSKMELIHDINLTQSGELDKNAPNGE
jgi:hypothetical protein